LYPRALAALLQRVARLRRERRAALLQRVARLRHERRAALLQRVALRLLAARGQ
jgi:hypothetical protein